MLFASASAWSAAGRTPTSVDVSSSGEARYSVPIFAPPGTAGMTPQLALSYGSRGGDGWLGVGWSVAGLSAIHRCNKTWAQDGAPNNVQNDATDRFCRDGNQLKLFSGTYGQPGAEYRTEIETFARIKSSGTAGTGPASFTVEQQDGLIYDYGTRADSQIEAQGQSTVRAWALTTIRDRAGNRIEFDYNEDATNGSFQIAAVRYTANPGAGLAAAYKVQFNYTTQPVGEVESGYLGGSVIKDIKRMTSVEVTYNATLVRRYTLAYEGSLSSAGRSRLASITECAGAAGTDCFAPTSFTYQSGTSGLAAEVSSGAVVPAAAVLTMDVNGDGRLDLVYSSSTTSGAGTWMVMFASASGGYASPINTGISNTNFSGATSIDYDSDGLYDLLVPYSGGTWWVMLGSASGLAAPVNTGAPATATGTGKNALATDVDGDGREDLVWADLVGYGGGDAIRYRLRLASGGFSASASTLVGPLAADSMIVSGLTAARAGSGPVTDMNGDGRGDVVYRRNTRVWIDGTGKWKYFYSIDAVCSGAWTFGITTTTAPAEPVLADLNGDGRVDIVYYDQSAAINYRFNTGKSFTAAGTAGSMSTFLGAFYVLDWDGDGYEDIVGAKISSSTWHLWRSTGEALSLPVDTGVAYSGGPLTTDINGDGLRDLAYINVSSGTWNYRLRAGVEPDLLLSATDGYGLTTSFAYTSIAQGSYTKGSGAVFPEQDTQIPLLVVSQLTGSNGIGGTYTNTFNYSGARRNLQGRGLGGFEHRIVTDSRNGVAVDETYQRAFPYTGAVTRVETRQSSGTMMGLSTRSLAVLSYGSGFETRNFPYPNAETNSQYEVGGAYNGALVRSSSTTNLVESTSGTLYDQTVVTTEPASGANGIRAGTTWTNRTYLPTAQLTSDATSWCRGRPGEVQQIQSHSAYGGGSITRTRQINWDTTACRPTSMIAQPGDAQWQVTTALGYDSFGNVSSQSVTGVGMAARTTSANFGATGQFPASATNALGQTSYFGWDAAKGVKTSETDPNSITTSWIFDNFGRRTHENRPDGTFTFWEYVECSVSGGCVSGLAKLNVIQWQYDASSNYVSHNVAYLDKFDRSLREATQLVSGDWRRVDRDYDALGRVSRESTGCLNSSCTQYWVNFGYDLANRVTQLNRPLSDSNSTPQYTYTYYEGLTTRVVDALGKQSTQIQDASGRTARSLDHNGYGQTIDYNAFGNPVRVQDTLGNTLQSSTYNIHGVRTALTDMDMGSWGYAPNALGEIVSQTDAKAQTTSFVFDGLGRMTQRTEAEGTSNWTWGTSAHNSVGAKYIGTLKSISGPGYSETYTRDALARPSSTTVNADTAYQIDYSYNTLGQLETLTYPTSTSGYRLKLDYDYQSGQLLRVKDFNAPSTVFYQVGAVNPASQVTQLSIGSGTLVTNRQFDAVTGLAKSFQTGVGGGSGVQNLSYTWDAAGNLTQRQDLNQSVSETFYYDNLYRLDYSQRNGSTNLDLSFDAMGNITSRTGVGNYTYHATKKHQLASTSNGWSFTHDANGNQTAGRGQTITPTSYNLPSTITATGVSSQFWYTPDRGYYKQQATYVDGTSTTMYIGGILEKVTSSSATQYRHMIRAPGATVIVSRSTTGWNTTFYATQDHLGSSSAVTDAAGALLVNSSFGAYGERRGANWAGAPSSGDWAQIANTTRRGYTEHSMLDNLSLIHMNGRVQDPVVGRFVSADPYIDAGLGTQGWNRYGYLGNRSLSATDPSGFEANDSKPKAFINPNECGKHPSTCSSWNSTWMARVETTDTSYAYQMSDGSIVPAGTVTTMWITSVGVGPLMNPTGNRGGPGNNPPDGPSGPGGPNPPTNNPAPEAPQKPPCGSGRPDDSFVEPSLMGFVKEEGLNVIGRTADVVGGLGMVFGGGAACLTGAGCIGGAPLATLGISSIQEGWTGQPGFVRSAATSTLGTRAGNATTDIINVGSSVTGLFRATLRPEAWSLFRNISSDFVPAYQTMTRTGLSIEIGGTVLGAASAACNYREN